MTADPKETMQQQTRALRGDGIESIAAVDKSAEFGGTCAGSQNGGKHTGLARACRPEDFCERAPRKALCERVHGGNARGSGFRGLLLAVLERGDDAPGECRFDFQ